MCSKIACVCVCVCVCMYVTYHTLQWNSLKSDTVNDFKSSQRNVHTPIYPCIYIYIYIYIHTHTFEYLYMSIRKSVGMYHDKHMYKQVLHGHATHMDYFDGLWRQFLVTTCCCCFGTQHFLLLKIYNAKVTSVQVNGITVGTCVFYAFKGTNESGENCACYMHAQCTGEGSYLPLFGWQWRLPWPAAAAFRLLPENDHHDMKMIVMTWYSTTIIICK
jgi:hypothetical protein